MTTSWRRPMVLGLLAVGLMVVVVGGWLARASISGAVIVPGTVAVRGKPQTVQHLDGGIVAEILVENGDAVAETDTLLRLEDTTIRANLAIYRNRLREVLAREARLTAELREDAAIAEADLLPTPIALEGLALALTAQERLLTARRDLRLGQLEQLAEQMAQHENQIAGVEGLIEAKTLQLDLVAEEIDAARRLVDQGLAARSQLNSLAREQAELQGQVAEFQAEIARLRNAIGETRIQHLQIGREHQETVLGERRVARAEIEELTQQIQATESQLARVEVRAPAGGVVHELAVTTIGGVVSPGAPIVQIIPIGRGVEVEAQVPTAEIERVFLGQAARLRFPAFNQRTTPEIMGEVSLVSATSVTDEATGVPFYRVDLIISDGERERLGTRDLTPGMPVEAFLITEDRTVVDYLAQPFTDYFNRALRER